MKILLYVLCSVLFFIHCKGPQHDDVIVMDVDGFPLIIELNRSDTYHYKRSINGNQFDAKIRLVDYQLHKEDNFWFDKELGQEDFYKAEVHIQVNGNDTILLARAYQMPIEIKGISIGVEAVKEWENHGNLDAARIPDMQKEVRMAISPAGELHAPISMRYPIKGYVWHASSYFNTWNALVPYNHRYYHRGEDMASIPDKLPVIAMFDGKVIASPLPDGDGASNGFMVETEYGISYRYAHINTDSFLPGLDSGVIVKAGEMIGLTGETWNGGKNQHSGPHLHTEWRYHDTKINLFPAMMEAYFREYPDPAIAIAGGYRFIKSGTIVELDGSRSLARPGEEIKKMQWITHNGDTVNQPIAQINIDQPGLYSEQLLVTTEKGFQDRDFLQVRVFDPNRGKNILCRHVMYTPVRGIEPGDSVLFWNRIENAESEVMIDFGDESRATVINEEISHQYHEPGNYVVTYSTTGPDNEPGTIQVEVKVE